MHARTVVIGLVGLLPAVLLAGCGSSSGPATTPTRTATGTPTTTAAATTTSGTASATGSFDSCTVVTSGQAAAALGQPVSAGVLGNATVEGGLACVFYGPSAPAPHTPNVAQPDTVRVVVVTGPNATKWYDAYRASPIVHPRSIAGYGDQAYYDGYASLSVLKGDTYLRVAVAPAGAPPSLPAEEQLAAAILPRL